ncbi:hemerythrin domain-containing protein [Streptosporangium sp. NPDC002721]|uniref:hemerythrin domain-containing protein n=1 Tax=Streptosporangium sp. NPDC002721 TaxID=3366188 RepID=UPI0036BE02D2
MLIDPNSPMGKPETQQMKVIHRAMRREFAQLPELIAAVPADDVARARLLGAHLTLVLDMLHEHHEAEDELLWPILVERVPLQKDLIEVMQRQHDAIAGAVGVIETELPGWTADARPAARDRVAGALRALESALTEHLELEESAVLPLIHEHLTVPEWLAPQEHAMKHGPKSLTGKLTLAGMVLEDATPRERTWFLSEMPAPARLLWRMMGARRYEAHTRAVRAGASA